MSARRIEQSLLACRTQGQPAIAAYLVGGMPDMEQFKRLLVCASKEADLVEVGVPFTDPLADGVSIAAASAESLRRGTTARNLIQALLEVKGDLQAPVVMMSYVNPLMAYGFKELARDAGLAGVSGFIVPDLPFEESGPFREALVTQGLALIPIVTPLTSRRRLEVLCAQARGFVYAVTRTGVTGGQSTIDRSTTRYLSEVRRASQLPVLAGFGVRSAEQVDALFRCADGAIVGTALVECVNAGGDLAGLLRSLKIQSNSVCGGVA